MNTSDTPPARSVKDNVIYAKFGASQQHDEPAQPATPTAVAPTITPHAQLRLLLTTICERGRYTRGVNYHRDGHVTSTDVRAGLVTGLVRGSQLDPFEVALHFASNPLDRDSIIGIPHALTLMSKGTYPQQIATQLFDIQRCECTCPDPAPVCKHAVAVGLAFADMLHSNPEKALALRHMSLATIADAIDAPPAADFWNGGQLPPLPDIEPDSALERGDRTLLTQAIRAASLNSVEALRGMYQLEEIYEHIMPTNPR